MFSSLARLAVRANAVVCEKNYGGQAITDVLKSRYSWLPVHTVVAKRGKQTRAEPIAAFHKLGRIHMVGTHQELEDQLSHWVPGEDSPDRLDAMVWGLRKLMLEPRKRAGALRRRHRRY